MDSCVTWIISINSRYLKLRSLFGTANQETLIMHCYASESCPDKQWTFKNLLLFPYQRQLTFRVTPRLLEGLSANFSLWPGSSDVQTRFEDSSSKKRHVDWKFIQNSLNVLSRFKQKCHSNSTGRAAIYVPWSPYQ